MKTYIHLFFFVLATNFNILFSQNCDSDGIAIVPIESFNHCNHEPWKLVFYDEFDGETLDLTKWEPITGVPRDKTFIKQKAWHSPENIKVENGNLMVISKKENNSNMPVDSWVTGEHTVTYEDFDYSTGEIVSKYKFGYGKYEARVKIPKGKGFWPAFWLFGDKPVYNEIDVFEFWKNNTNSHNMTVHYDYGEGTSYCHTHYSGVDFSESFHVFTLIWEEDKIEWYVDGQLKRADYKYYTILGQAGGCNIFSWNQYILNRLLPEDPMKIILNTAIEEGDYSPDNTTPFPSHMEVDWVRYYKRVPSEEKVFVDETSDFRLSDEVFNVLLGDEVYISSDFSLLGGQQLDIIANTSVVLESGVNISKAEFKAQVSTSRNQSEYRLAQSLSLDPSVMMLEDDTAYTSMHNKNPISGYVYPNPNKGIFTVDLSDFDINHLSIRLINTFGQLLHTNDKINEQQISFNLESYSNGIYFLVVSDRKTQENMTHKIIVQ